MNFRDLNLTFETVRELLDYKENNGDVFWLKRDVKWFNETPKRTAQASCNIWNVKHAGTFAGVETNKYFATCIQAIRYKTHRLIWLWVTGEHAMGEIDHKNGNSLDNSWKNLRVVSHQENSKNRKVPSNNTSGFMGVSWHIHEEKWIAYGNNSEGKYVRIGAFDTKEEAYSARLEFLKQESYYALHGKR